MISAVRADAFVESRQPAKGLSVRKAVMHDIPPILDLINGYAAKGQMLPRTEFEMSESIRDFTVVSMGGELLGCGADRVEQAGERRQRQAAEHRPASQDRHADDEREVGPDEEGAGGEYERRGRERRQA